MRTAVDLAAVAPNLPPMMNLAARVASQFLSEADRARGMKLNLADDEPAEEAAEPYDFQESHADIGRALGIPASVMKTL